MADPARATLANTTTCVAETGEAGLQGKVEPDGEGAFAVDAFEEFAPVGAGGGLDVHRTHDGFGKRRPGFESLVFEHADDGVGLLDASSGGEPAWRFRHQK